MAEERAAERQLESPQGNRLRSSFWLRLFFHSLFSSLFECKYFLLAFTILTKTKTFFLFQVALPYAAKTVGETRKRNIRWTVISEMSL